MTHDGAAPSDDTTSDSSAGFSLFFDSRNALALDGVRTAATSGDVIHLAYAADQADLVLDVTVGARGLLTVAGQVLSHGVPPGASSESTAEGLTVSVHSGADSPAQARGDAAGRFRLPAVPAPLTRFTAVNGPVRIDLPLDLP